MGPFDWQLERYRPLLRLQVRQMQLHARFQKCFDSSDLVQTTLLKAHKNLAQFRGHTEKELVRWLKRILENATKDAIDREKGMLDRVQSLDKALAASSIRLEAFLAANQSSPSQRAEREEQLVRLAAALDELPEDQRDAVIHHHLLGTPVAQIAQQMGRTEKSICGLLYRGLMELRQRLQDHD
jgi:RNA polymerase sigma-70 factor (ECF subfamily)